MTDIKIILTNARKQEAMRIFLEAYDLWSVQIHDYDFDDPDAPPCPTLLGVMLRLQTEQYDKDTPTFNGKEI